MKKLNFISTSRRIFLLPITEYRLRITVLTALCLCASVVKSDTHYASLDGKNVPPFVSWGNAATNIQDAVYAAIIGDTVVVSDGVYFVFSEIRVTNHITIESFSGAENTIVDAGFPANSNRCFYTADDNWISLGVVDGFTMQNGCSASGGGIACGGKAIVKNCTIKNNIAFGSPGIGGGFSLDFLGIISNCVITGNSAEGGGGGDNSNGSVVRNCIISNNISTLSGGGGLRPGWNGFVYDCKIIDNVATSSILGIGGGIDFAGDNGIVENCVIEGNLARKGGGVAFFGDYCLLNKCIVISNTALETAGGIFFFQHSGGGNVRNCLIVYNSSPGNYNGIRIEGSAIIDSCTIAKHSGVGVRFEGPATVRNTVIAQNQLGPTSVNDDGVRFYYCSMQAGYPPPYDCGGNILYGEVFQDVANGDFRLADNSPCIANGTNMDWMVGTTDLAGNERKFDYRVDMGCYETIPEISVIGYQLSVIGILIIAQSRKGRKVYWPK